MVHGRGRDIIKTGYPRIFMMGIGTWKVVSDAECELKAIYMKSEAKFSYYSKCFKYHNVNSYSSAFCRSVENRELFNSSRICSYGRY